MFDAISKCFSFKVSMKEFSTFSLRYAHCEIAGWGMQEYNNSDSYPDSIRAARIRVGEVR